MAGTADTDARREARVQAKVAELQACAGDYSRLNQEQEAGRLAWWETHKEGLRLAGSLPRQAYTLFLIEYLKLDPAEVPVVYEDDRRIVWRSFNFCPLLEACQRLGLDTREVCRQAAERSVQTLVERLDPRLEFRRDYQHGIRPHAAYCEESVELNAL